MQKCFLINGCNGGLGLELTKRILADGDKVVGFGRSVIEDVYVRRHKSFSFYKLPCYSTEAFTDCFKLLKSAKNEVTHLILNGGSALGMTEVMETENLRNCFEANFFSHVELLRLTVDEMKDLECVCFVSSVSGSEAHGHPLYSAAKAAVLAYARSVGRFLSGKGVSVFSVSPGAFVANSGYWYDVSQADAVRYDNFVKSRLTVSSMPTANQVADFIYVLCQSHSVNMAGCDYRYDGGQGRSW